MPSEIQLKIDRIIDQSFRPTQQQKISSILLIVSSLNFESVLTHALKVQYNQDNIDDLTERELDELFQMARTWRYQADQDRDSACEDVVVNLNPADR